MKVKEYNLMEECVETGIRFGINRAYKYLDDQQSFPDRDTLERNLIHEIMVSIGEKFIFEGGPEDE